MSQEAPRETPADPPESSDLGNDLRERRIWWSIAAVGAVLAVGFMILVWPIIQGRLDAAGELDQATSLASGVQTPVAAVDSVVRGEVTTSTLVAAVAASSSIPPTRARLARAVTMVDDGYPHLTEDEQRRANLVKAALVARIAMLDAAPAIISAGVQAAHARPLAEEAWAKTLAADALTHRAAAQYNLRTATAAKAGASLNAQAEQTFSAARTLYSQAATDFPAANLEVYVAYVDQRLVQSALARRSSAAMASGDVAQANALIAAYNAADAKSVAMASRLPASPAAAIDAAYRLATQSAMDAYNKARESAADADTALKTL